jgi:hypothetical protein
LKNSSASLTISSGGFFVLKDSLSIAYLVRSFLVLSDFRTDFRCAFGWFRFRCLHNLANLVS